MNKSIHKKFRPLYWNFRRIILNNSIISKYLRNRIINENVENQICPICKSKLISTVHFYFEQEDIFKFYCKECNHVFTNNLRANIEKGFKLFNYEIENEHLDDQKYLLFLLEKNTRNISRKTRKFLDFGISGNYRHLLELNINSDNVTFEGCDIFPNERKYYFQSYSDDSKLGIFDGISSNAVIEHLDDTLNSWKYLNKLLKPIDEGEGIMIHAFPSQINEDYLHWAIKIKSHECLFSQKSLSIICSHTGFELNNITNSSKVQHPIFFFKKVRDLF